MPEAAARQRSMSSAPCEGIPSHRPVNVFSRTGIEVAAGNDLLDLHVAVCSRLPAGDRPHTGTGPWLRPPSGSGWMRNVSAKAHPHTVLRPGARTSPHRPGSDHGESTRA